MFSPKREVWADERSIHDSLFELQAQIQGYRTRLEENLSAVKTIKDATSLLDMRIKKIALEKILTRQMLQRTETALAVHEERIRQHALRIEHERNILAELIRDISLRDTGRLVMALSRVSISRFFEEIRNAELLHNAVREQIRVVREEQRRLQDEKRGLEFRVEESALLHEAQVRQELLLLEEDDRKRALAVYSGKRATLFAELLERSKVASSSLQQEFFIREGVGTKLSLAQAYAKADTSARRTGIRTALLVALLAQESYFGSQQGTGVWKEDMHPSQWPSFLIIVQRLGLDPDTVPVSKKPDYGWGGALGPTQFLPDTWLGYEDRIREFTGHAQPSPWNIDDAFFGTALKLAENGAAGKTETAERKATLMYFAGDNWENPAFAFYADSILELAHQIEQELKIIL